MTLLRSWKLVLLQYNSRSNWVNTTKGKGIRVFNVTAKSHMLMHLALYAGHVHPKLGWCFQGEDFMRVIQTLLQSCIRGNNPFQSMSKATVHYNLAKQLQYEKID